MLQVGVKSRGYDTSNTFFEPLKSDRETIVSRWLGNVKSGAVAPAAISAMDCTTSFLTMERDLEKDQGASLEHTVTQILSPPQAH